VLVAVAGFILLLVSSRTFRTLVLTALLTLGHGSSHGGTGGGSFGGGGFSGSGSCSDGGFSGGGGSSGGGASGGW
jgi:uncharacterized protein